MMDALAKAAAAAPDSPWYLVALIAMVKGGVVLFALLTFAGYAVYVERKLIGYLQHRIGPNRAGPFGLLQPLADVLKLLTKEESYPPFVDKALFVAAPAIIMVTGILAFAVIPFGPSDWLVIADINAGVLLFLALSSLGVYSIVLAGWSSNSKYSMLGGLRATAQMISYELALSLSIVGVELGRMTQYKDKSAKGGENLNSALFTYPVLMASDILLYSTDLVPVGEDQKQHLELSRDLAQRFNNRYSDTFKIPEVYTPKVGARIMSLQDPTKKMSKSDENENGYISLMDSHDVIIKKVKRAVTDSIGEVNYSQDQPGIKNLLEICSKFENASPQDIALRYQGKGYGEFKSDAAEIIAEGLRPVREKALEYLGDKSYLEGIYSEGAQKAEAVASKMLSKVYRKIGFIPKKRI